MSIFNVLVKGIKAAYLILAKPIMKTELTVLNCKCMYFNMAARRLMIHIFICGCMRPKTFLYLVRDDIEKNIFHHSEIVLKMIKYSKIPC